jgi:RHS repeat-associated protein
MRAKMNMSRRLALSMALWVTAGVTYAQNTPAPYTTGYRYDADSRLVGTIRPSSIGSSGPFLASRSIYNAQGLVDHEDQGFLAAWQAETVQPASWTGFTIVQSVYYTYDTSGRKLTETESSGATAYTLTQYNYDNQGRVLCATQRMNSAAFGSLPDACTLGAQGTQGPDRITRTTYESLGRPLQIQKAYGTPLAYTYATYAYYTGPQQSVYDSNGNVALTFNASAPLQSVTDADGNCTYYAYDNLIRLQYLYFPSPTTKGIQNNADYEQYSYDLNGNRKSLRKRDGNTISYDYDGLNRELDEIYPASTIQSVYYGYDLRNLQLFARFGSSAGPGLTQTYEGFGHVLTASTNQSGAALTLSYQYDAEGNRIRVTHPDSSYFQYAYDGLNRLSTIKENGSATVVAQTYDTAGRRWTLQRGANVSTTTALYDGVSRLQTLTQDLQGTSYDETRSFGYNAANQVTSRTLSVATYSFTQVPATGTAYQVNGLNQYTLLTLTGFVGPTVPVVPTYDPNGNMTSDGASVFKYDVLNRMISSTGAKTVALSYDPNGRLFQTSGGASGVTQFLYDGNALVAEYNGSGTLLRRYVHGSAVDEPLVTYEGASVGAANRRYFHVDAQNSVIAMVDANGNELQVNTYDPYGVPSTGNSAGNVTRFQYTGQIMLPDLGQYYYKARIYNSAIGRFMQTDPVGFKDDVDMYSYVGEDPMDHGDPTGLMAEITWTSNNTATLTIPYRMNESAHNAAFTGVQLEAAVAKTYSGKVSINGVSVTVTAHAIAVSDPAKTNTITVGPKDLGAHTDKIGGDQISVSSNTQLAGANHEMGHAAGAGDQYPNGIDAHGATIDPYHPTPGAGGVMADTSFKVNQQTLKEILTAPTNVNTCVKSATAPPTGKC